MRRCTSSLFLILAVVILAGCAGNSDKKETQQMSLMDLMTGSFDSKKQSEADSSYYHISLHMYPIWKNREGDWLYVEQALASTQDKPYRQRIYKLEAQADGTYKSSVFLLKDQEQFIGKWKEPGFFSQFTANSLLTEREGCAVIMKRLDDNTFTGATVDKHCTSTLSGASYATSKVTVSPNQVESWDQGFDSRDEQVWGAEKGGYIFDRLNQ